MYPVTVIALVIAELVQFRLNGNSHPLYTQHIPEHMSNFFTLHFDDIIFNIWLFFNDKRLPELKKITSFPLYRPGLTGALVPADSAQPHMKDTINNIQNKLDHLYNRTQVRNKYLFLCLSTYLQFK